MIRPVDIFFCWGWGVIIAVNQGGGLGGVEVRFNESADLVTSDPVYDLYRQLWLGLHGQWHITKPGADVVLRCMPWLQAVIAMRMTWLLAVVVKRTAKSLNIITINIMSLTVHLQHRPTILTEKLAILQSTLNQILAQTWKIMRPRGALMLSWIGMSNQLV